MITNEHSTAPPRETIVQENGRVRADIDENLQRPYGILSEYYDNKTNRPLKLKRKLWEFYTAPITKFWANAVSFYQLIKLGQIY